jgi:hypothetical protein
VQPETLSGAQREEEEEEGGEWRDAFHSSICIFFFDDMDAHVGWGGGVWERWMVNGGDVFRLF